MSLKLPLYQDTLLTNVLQTFTIALVFHRYNLNVCHPRPFCSFIDSNYHEMTKVFKTFWVANFYREYGTYICTYVRIHVCSIRMLLTRRLTILTHNRYTQTCFPSTHHTYVHTAHISNSWCTRVRTHPHPAPPRPAPPTPHQCESSSMQSS